MAEKVLTAVLRQYGRHTVLGAPWGATRLLAEKQTDQVIDLAA
jgi:hypothetical protein